MRIALAVSLFLMFGAARAKALEFPEVSCVTPTATVSIIGGIDSRDAHMEGRYTLPDIQEGCSQGWVDQGSTQPPEHCVNVNRELLKAPPLHASADCTAGTMKLEGTFYKMPVDDNCASGGIHAAKAFKLLCPSYAGKIKSGE